MAMKTKHVILGLYFLLLCFWLVLVITDKFHVPQMMSDRLIFFVGIGLTILCVLHGWLPFSKQKTKYQLVMAIIVSILAGIYLWRLLF